jgi:hypothetical protein
MFTYFHVDQFIYFIYQARWLNFWLKYSKLFLSFVNFSAPIVILLNRSFKTFPTSPFVRVHSYALKNYPISHLDSHVYSANYRTDLQYVLPFFTLKSELLPQDTYRECNITPFPPQILHCYSFKTDETLKITKHNFALKRNFRGLCHVTTISHDENAFLRSW